MQELNDNSLYRVKQILGDPKAIPPVNWHAKLTHFGG